MIETTLAYRNIFTIYLYIYIYTHTYSNIFFNHSKEVMFVFTTMLVKESVRVSEYKRSKISKILQHSREVRTIQ